MRNLEHVSWKPLYHSDDLERARLVATCVASMEFDVRLEPAGLEGRMDLDEDLGEHDFFVVEVPTADWGQLAEVLEEILDEQEQFDALIACMNDRRGRAERHLLIAMVIIVGTLGAAGVIEL